MFAWPQNLKHQSELRIKSSCDNVVVIVNIFTLVDAFLNAIRWKCLSLNLFFFFTKFSFYSLKNIYYFYITFLFSFYIYYLFFLGCTKNYRVQVNHISTTSLFKVSFTLLSFYYHLSSSFSVLQINSIKF